MRLVGRQAEFQLLGRALSETRRGHTNVVLLSGEPGIGKTAILRGLSASIDKGVFHAIYSGYTPGTIESQDTLRSHIVEDCRKRADQIVDDVGVLTNNIPDQLSRSRAGDLHETDTLNVSRIRELLIAAARSRPFVIVLDDIHFIDEDSLDLLSSLSLSLHDVPICIIAAYRPLEMERISPHSAFEAIKRRALNLELRSLSATATGELLKGATSFKIGIDQLETLRRLTGGNPRLILEYQAGIEPEGAPTSLHLNVPITIGLSIAMNERLFGMSLGERSLLACAAVIGDNFEQEVAIKLAKSDRLEALRTFSEFEKRGLIRPAGVGQFEFNPGLLRGVLYHELPPDLRASHHHETAMILKELVVAQGNEYLEERIAHHLLESRQPETVENALEHARLAGRRFLSVGNYAKACEMYALALEASRRCGSESDGNICDRLSEYAVAIREKGEFAASEEIFRQAVEFAERLGETQRFCELALKVPDYHWPLPGSSSSLAILLCERALMLVDNSGLKAHLASRLAGELSYDPSQKQRTSELMQLSMEAASKLNNPKLTLQVLRFRDCTLRHPDTLEERVANAAQMCQLAREMGDHVALWEASTARSVSLIALGRLNEAEREFQILEQTAQLVRRPIYRILHLVSLVGRASFFGNFAECDRIFTLARSEAAARQVPEILSCCWPALALGYAETERLPELDSMANEARRYSEPPAVQALRCWLNAKLGRHFEARTQLHHIAVNDFAELRGSADFLAGAVALASACLRIGNAHRHAQRLYELLLPYVDRDAVLGQIAHLGSVAYCLGRLANSLSSRDDAISHLQAALERHSQMEARPWSLYAAYELASILLKDENRERRRYASALLSQIKAEAGARDMRYLARRVADLWATGANPQVAAFDNDSILNLGLPVSAGVEEKPDGALRSSGVFRKTDRYWTLTYRGQTARTKDRKGLALISTLMSKPREAFHVAALVGVIDGAHNSSQELIEGFTPTDLGAMIDPEAKRSYQARAQELREDLNEARINNDLGRAEALEQELRFLTRELARAVGLYGRDRANLSSNERARLRVTNVIRSAISELSLHHTALGEHLAASIRTGLYCSYRPDADSLIDWEL